MASTEAVKQVASISAVTCQACKSIPTYSGELEISTIRGHNVPVVLAQTHSQFNYEVECEGHSCGWNCSPAELKCDRMLSEYWKKVDNVGFVLDVVAQEERAAVMMRVASAEQEKVEAMMKAAKEAKKEVETMRKKASEAIKPVVSKKRKTK